MSKDCREELLKNVKLVLMESNDIDIIFNKVSILLDNYEISEKETSLTVTDTSNLDLIKLYASTLIVEGKEESTVKFYAEELQRLIKRIGGRDVRDLDTFDIRKYLAMRQLEGISNRTLDTTRTVISTFYHWMEVEEIISKNPCSVIKPIKYTRKIESPFTSIELDDIRNVCKNIKERCLIEFLLASGVRVSELCDLLISDVDFVKNKVHIRCGKGGKERYTYITDLAKNYLIQYLNGRCSGYLFKPQRGTQYKSGGIRYILKSLGERCNVDNVHPHRFRKTFASQLASRGMSIQEIQKLLGHSNINTTMIYVITLDLDVQYAYKKYSN